MADPSFFIAGGPYAVLELAEIAGTEVSVGAKSGAAFKTVAPLALRAEKNASKRWQ